MFKCQQTPELYSTKYKDISSLNSSLEINSSHKPTFKDINTIRHRKYKESVCRYPQKVCNECQENEIVLKGKSSLRTSIERVYQQRLCTNVKLKRTINIGGTPKQQRTCNMIKKLDPLSFSVHYSKKKGSDLNEECNNVLK